MLSLSQTTGYAIRAMCALGHAEEGFLLARDIAERTGVPKPYLSRLLCWLGQAGLILTKRGHGGGFALARHPRDISLLDIARAVEGPRMRPRCLLGQVECSDERSCPMHTFWKAQRAKIEDELQRRTLDSVAAFEAQNGTLAAHRFGAARARRPRGKRPPAHRARS